MAEVLFIATTIFVAYVILEVVGKKHTPESNKPAETPASNPEPSTIITATVSTPPPTETKKPVAKKPASPAKKPAAPKTAASASTPKTASSGATDNSLKNPKTGEVARMPNNYAFAKRWIKEALVEEGLLDKIYKNNELDPTTTEKIKTALQQLKEMEKYQ